MKSIFLCLLFTCMFGHIFAQKKDSLTNKTIIEIERSKKGFIKNKKLEDFISKQIKIDSLQSAIMTEAWNTVKFNPYEYQLKKDPFRITFTDSTYASPIERKKVITSRYGWRKGRPHRGIDIDLVTGDNVLAMFDGVIRFRGYSSGHGKMVVIRHYNGLETAYAHLSKYDVKVNEVVKKGQVIGKGGTTGNARGSHLHLIVSYKGNYINPEYLFDFGEENKIRKQDQWINNNWVTTYFHSSKKQSDLVFYDSYEEALTNQKKQSIKKIHTVKSGDTLSGISNKYRTSISKICKINAISKKSVLKIGKRLIIM